MSTTIRIRRGQVTDVTAVFALLVAAYDDAGTAYPVVDRERLMAWALETIIDGEVWIADLAGRVIGSIGLADFQFPWSARWYLNTSWVFVLPKFRARGAGAALLDAVCQSADAKGAPLILATHSGRDSATVDAIFARAAGVYTGATFFRPAKGV